MKNTYQKSLSQCGVDKSMVNENAKAMESMVSSLKNAYAKAPLCDGTQDAKAIISSAVGQLNKMDKQATSIASARTMTLMDDAAVGSRSFTNLVKQIQEQQQQVQNSTAKEGQVDKEELKQKSLESIDEMLRSAKEDQEKKLTKIARLKQKRRNSNVKPKAQPQQTFIVPINMPSRKNNGYSEIE
jgi:inhibitor of KinA sporulation pathway (predicted exonuclease)